MATTLTTLELTSIIAGRGLQKGFSTDLPPPAADLNLMARRGFSSQLHHQRFRLIMQGVAGHPLLPSF